MSPLSIPVTLRPARICAILLLSTLIGGCASANLNQAVSSVGGSAAPDAFQGARLAPFNAREHMATSLFLLEHASGRPAEIELAKSGFQTAARLAPDMWEPLVGLAACQYRLGEYSDALASLAEAVDRRGRIGDLATPLALVAYRAHHPGLARLAFSAAPAGDGAGQAFLTRAFGESGAWKPDPPAPAPVRPPLAAPVRPLLPTAAVSEPKGDAKVDPAAAPAEAGADASKPTGSPDSDRNVLIEAFMIRDERTATSTNGLNLLDSLALSFAGTVVNLNHDGAGTTVTNNLQVTLPNVTYSLNLASRDMSQVALEASPVVIARQGKTSKFLEGGSVLIIPSANGVQPIDKDVGLTLQVTPDLIGPDFVDLTVVLELSNITGRSLNNGARTASVLETDKTHIEVTARVPYQKAMMIGSTGTLIRKSGDTRALLRIPLPGFSSRSAAADRRDVIALITVRRPEDDMYLPVDESALAKRLFGRPLPASESYGERPSDTPDPELDRLLMSVRP